MSMGKAYRNKNQKKIELSDKISLTRKCDLILGLSDPHRLINPELTIAEDRLKRFKDAGKKK